MIVNVTYRGLLFYALLEAGFAPVAVVDGIATMRILT